MNGYFVLVLHSHLPYVNHPNHDLYLEERWYVEAVLESYIPLLMMFDRLQERKVPFKITVSLSPTLLEMFRNTVLNEKLKNYTQKLVELCEKEQERVKTHQEKELANFYRERFLSCLSYLESVGGNLAKGFKKHAESGNIELITCNATHGFLPLMRHQPFAVEAQIAVGVETFAQHFGFKPKGVWLAECGYYSGLDEVLKKYGLGFFFVDSHAFWYADERPYFDVYRPIMTPSGVFAFARDPDSSEQVWSATTGYPGDGRYREFYRDLGFDGDYEYVRPYIDKSGVRVNVGIKYHRITSKETPLDKKCLYSREDAMTAAREHAIDFLNKKLAQVNTLIETFNQPPVIVAPFDTELFGHWWFEGPEFLENFFVEASKQKQLKFATPSEIIERFDSYQVLTPADSSWGNGGYFDTWLNGKNDWIQPHLVEIRDRMKRLAETYFEERDPLKVRVLNQMLRELLLAEASDWPFIITTGTSVEYAVNRIKTHVKRFLDLEQQLVKDNIDGQQLARLEQEDNVFASIDYRLYAGSHIGKEG
ncbi:glycoside hydrolase family 57 protein [Thermotoga caldifontis]|uniref:glycoside hydrolase family 57 protein n=1 Tax=Thermotoga caldifontis TaxID=1508419 RepID=UPI0005973EA8|nr:1,4-alpha-glucan branching protein domain-containing protein [Thermotoga caldifontis]